MTVSAAIVDYGFGNLFSVKQASMRAGMDVAITSDPAVVAAADVVILPGVGAFGDAMDSLRSLDLVATLRDVPGRGGVLMGVCLGMQLLMKESYEFGVHKGLGLIDGEVVRLNAGKLKVPHIGWSRVEPVGTWEGTPLAPVPPGTHMYFLHSYHVSPGGAGVALSTTQYGDAEFCSSVEQEGLFATQFHPERSGPLGLRIYEAIARRADMEGELHVPS